MAVFCLFYCKLYLFNPVFGLFRRPRITDISLSGGEASNRDAVGRAGNVGKTDFVAELYGRGVAAVFAADAAGHARTGLSALLDSHFHQRAHALLVEASERVGLVNLVRVVSAEELACVVAAEAERHLGKVVGAEAEELSFFCHFVGGEASSKKTSSVANFLSWYHILEHMKNKA